MILKNLKFFAKIAWEKERSFFVFFVINFTAMCVFSVATIRIPELVLNMVNSRVVIWNQLLLIFSTLVVSGLVSSLCKYHMTPMGYRIRYYLLGSIMEQNLKLPFDIYEDPKHLNNTWTVYRSVSSVDGVQGLFLNLIDLSTNGAVVAVSIGFLWGLNVFLAIFVSLWLIIYSWRYIKNIDALDRMYNENRLVYREHDYLADLGIDFSYAKDIRVFKMQPWLKRKFDRASEVLNDVSYRFESLNLPLNLFDSLFQFLRDSFMYGILISQYFSGNISLAEFSMYSVLVMQLNGALKLIATNFQQILSHTENYHEMIRYLELERGDDSGESIELGEDWNLEFKNVSFKYPGTDHEIYKDLNFSIQKGQKVAIVGLNGVGKSTLVKLLMRLYNPTEGVIYLNGIDIKKYNLKQYFSLFAPVFQDINLFPYSLKENLSFDEMIDEDVLIDAMRHAGFLDKFNSLKDGFDTELTRYISEEGVNFSGGEAQKFVMARALGYKRPILVLDEPTSALDAVAEYEFYNSISENLSDETVLFVSHRLASTSFCDTIVLIDNKTIAESGTHEALLELNGLYSKLFNTQAQYYKEGGMDDEA